MHVFILATHQIPTIGKAFSPRLDKLGNGMRRYDKLGASGWSNKDTGPLKSGGIRSRRPAVVARCAILGSVSGKKMSDGKKARLRALADERGVIAALAMDQRNSLRKVLSAAGAPAATDEQLSEFKEAVTRHLSPYASAVLLDPEYGQRAAASKAAGCGLLLTYECDGFENPRPHRMLELLPEFSVRRLGELGAQGVKILLSWAPDGDAAAYERKRALIERIGAECAAFDLPFFLEPVVYDPEGSSGFLRRKPEWVARTMEEFSRDRYLADVLKVEFPVSAAAVREGVFTKEEALDWYRRADGACRLPYIYLSAGVSSEEFTASLRLAGESGASFSGVLCGRANWQGGAAAYVRSGVGALEEWLAAEGVRNMRAVNERLSAAVAWHERAA